MQLQIPSAVGFFHKLLSPCASSCPLTSNQLPIRDLRKRFSADDRIDILAALSGG